MKALHDALQNLPVIDGRQIRHIFQKERFGFQLAHKANIVIQKAGSLILRAFALSGDREWLTWRSADKKIDLSNACAAEQLLPLGFAQVVANPHTSAIGMIVIVDID